MDAPWLLGSLAPWLIGSLAPWLIASLAKTSLISATSQGTNVRLAQHIFSLLYLVNLALVFRIMVKTRKVLTAPLLPLTPFVCRTQEGPAM